MSTLGIQAEAVQAAGLLIYRLINSQDIQFLILKASYRKKHWSPPKGSVEVGESDYEAALRETQEETGYLREDLIIHNNITRVLKYEVEERPKVVKYFLTQLKTTDKEPVLSDEHTEYLFVNINDIIRLTTYPNFIEMLEHFEREIRKMHRFRNQF